MNAQEYRKTLTPLQAKAFYKLLETRLQEAGYYRRNVETNNATDALQRGAVKDMEEEFTTLKNDYYQEKEEIERQIKELRERASQLWDNFRKAEEELYHKAYLKVEDKVQEIRKARGNASQEREIIETLAIAEYQKRLDKKAKKEVA